MSICQKEINRFFSSLTGYLAIVLFILVCGIFLFLLPQSSILNNNYASLSQFFEIAPWVLLFLVPAICMHTLADEYKQGTFEVLKTKPITNWQIVVGKYLAILIVLAIVLLPTITYVITIKLLSINGDIDGGGILGSYIGLYLLAATFAAISLCCSGFTNNAVVAFLISGFVCISIYYGFNGLSKLPFLANTYDYVIEMLGIDYHYKSISRGVIDSRAVIYFCSIIFLSLTITQQNIKKR